MSDQLLRALSPDDVRRAAPRPLDRETLEQAGAILADIDARADAAALDYAVRFGDLRPGEPPLLRPDELARARDRIGPGDRALLERTADRIRAFALAQRASITDLALPVPGGRVGHAWLPVGSAGCYAPGGRFPLPSSVLMTAITARSAGVREVWVASPKPTDITLAAASIAGADGLLRIGGVQAVAALARGLLGIPAPGCAMIVGPGNRWVTAAKHIVSAQVGIDMLAGPSELLVLADDSADPAIIAADLLAQAEHDDDAVPMLITTCPSLPDRVEIELAGQLGALPSPATPARALQNGFSVIAGTLERAIELADAIAPEHLEVLTRDPDAVAQRLANAGAVFIGRGAAEVLGDYGVGPNHVLPTGGTARFKAGLSVMSFLRARTWLAIDRQGEAHELRRDAAALARLELLEAHARAAEIRAELAEPRV